VFSPFFFKVVLFYLKNNSGTQGRVNLPTPNNTKRRFTHNLHQTGSNLSQCPEHFLTALRPKFHPLKTPKTLINFGSRPDWGKDFSETSLCFKDDYPAPPKDLLNIGSNPN